MATFRLPILGWATAPDTSGNVWMEPLSIAATNDRWPHLVWRFKDTSTRPAIEGVFSVPKNYNASGTTSFVIVWSSTATSGNVVWDADYRAVTGNDSESLDQTTQDEQLTVTDAAPGAAWRRLETSVSATAANFAADDTVQFEFARDGVSGSDTMAADAYLFGLFFQYTD
jgi:hypothetical protein